MELVDGVIIIWRKKRYSDLHNITLVSKVMPIFSLIKSFNVNCDNSNLKIKNGCKSFWKSERIPANEKRKQFVKKKTSKAGTVLIKWNISVFRKKGNKLNLISSYFCQGGVEIKIKSNNKFQYWHNSNWKGKNIKNCGKSKTLTEL